MKLYTLTIIALLLVGCAVAAEPRINVAQVNWTQTLPSGEGLIFSGTAPASTTGKLYVDGGGLMFDGQTIGSGGAGVTGTVKVIAQNGVVTAYDPVGGTIDTGTSGAGGDDTRVLQAGLSYLNDTYFSIETYGTFYTDDDLLLPDKLHWSGHNSLIIDDLTNTTDHDSMLRDNNASALKEYTSTWVIRDLILDGLGKATVDYGLNASRIRHAQLENINVLHMQKDGFLIRDDSWMTALINCKTYDNAVNAVHFVAGANDKPNGCVIFGGRFMADDTVGVYIENGGDIRMIGADVESTGTAVYVLDNSSLISGCYFEACTNGLYLGSGAKTVYSANIRDNAFYSVTNPITFVSCSSNSVKMSGNRNDGASIDEWIGTGSGTGNWQTITIPTTYPGTIRYITIWYTQSGIVNSPDFYIASGKLYVYANNGRAYQYCASFGA